jgi:hypothetical protein
VKDGNHRTDNYRKYFRNFYGSKSHAPLKELKIEKGTKEPIPNIKIPLYES